MPSKLPFIARPNFLSQNLKHYHHEIFAGNTRCENFTHEKWFRTVIYFMNESSIYLRGREGALL